MADSVVFHLVVRVLEPADVLPGSLSRQSVSATFTKRNVWAAAVPRVGERIEAASLGEHCARHFASPLLVRDVEHRLGQGMKRPPATYVLVHLELTVLTDAVIDDFRADGFAVRLRDEPEELRPILP